MILCSRLVKEYSGFRALDGIEFEVERGRIFGVVGHNGAGKTTLLKIASGLVRPTSGSFIVDGTDITQDATHLKEFLGYLPEESRLYDSMTVRSYLSFFGELYGMGSGEIVERQEALLKALSMEELDRRCGELSKGMRRKVAIARSLLHDPSLLVYDEPASGLDPMTSRFIADFLKELRRKGKTILLSAHNLYQVEELCDTVMILRRGRVAALGSMHELREHFGSVTYRIWVVPPEKRILEASVQGVTWQRQGELATAEVPDIRRLNELTAKLAASGVRIERIETRYPTLEEMLVKVGA